MSGVDQGYSMNQIPLLIERAGSVVQIKLNRPNRRNALDDALVDSLGNALEQVARTAECRAVVITGTGSAFCAGGDMAANSDVDVTQAAARQRRFLEVAERLMRLPKPTVAAVNGAAVGAGLSLALICDEIVVQRNAKLSLGFLALGLPPDLLAAATLQRRVGWTVATDLLHTGRFLPAEEAVRLGLVHQMADDALAVALERAEALARVSQSAFAATKALLLHSSVSHTTVSDLEAYAVAASVGSQEFKESTARFRKHDGDQPHTTRG
jgi:2-(1,2-epoxy-1,2-dihydrophenyl)acetyl-CoA isomerase